MKEAHVGACMWCVSVKAKITGSCQKNELHWLTVVCDCVDFAKRRDACQLHANFIY